MTHPLPWYLYVILATFVLIGLWMIVRPKAVVRSFQKAAAESHDPLSGINREMFNPSRAARNASTFRLVGIGWVVIAALMMLLVYASRQ